MKLIDFIDRKAIIADLKAKDKKGAVQELVKVARSALGNSKLSVAEITSAVMAREKNGSTGIGRGIALPHARSPIVPRLIGAFGRSKSGIPFDSIDGEPVHILFLVLSPEKAEEYHQALKSLSETLRQGNFANFLRAAKTVKDIEEILKDAEELIKV